MANWKRRLRGTGRRNRGRTVVCGVTCDFVWRRNSRTLEELRGGSSNRWFVITCGDRWQREHGFWGNNPHWYPYR